VSGPRRAEDFPYFDNDGLPLAFAHRGGSLTDSLHLENTMAAFETAVDLGYRYIETDVNATADGVLLTLHDATVDRLTGEAGTISELDYAKVAKMRIGGTEPIPRLEDVLTAWPDLRLNIDAKSPSSVPLLATAIHAHRAWDRVCIASFSAWSLRAMRELLTPRVATSFSPPGSATLRLLPGRRLRSLFLRKGVVAQVPVRNHGLEVPTPAFIDRAHELGKHVHVWTIDDPAEMVRLFDLGVDGIFTDRIDVLRDAYLARGIWKE
jgi:glycerophosphoryl diester phosphodiesterase